MIIKRFKTGFFSEPADVDAWLNLLPAPTIVGYVAETYQVISQARSPYGDLYPDETTGGGVWITVTYEEEVEK